MNVATESTNRQSELVESTMMKVRNLEEERAVLEAKIHKLESELTSSDLSRESLRRDKQTVISNISLGDIKATLTRNTKNKKLKTLYN